MPNRIDELLDGLRGARREHNLGELGQGAVGVVDRVFDARLGRVVARKTLRSELLADENAVRTFVNEAKILGQLDHGAVIPIFDAYVNEDGAPVYTMREIAGVSLTRALQMKRSTGVCTPISLDRTLKIISQLCDAMSHAHDRGVLHLDLKPENIIVLPHDQVVLVDWGAARLYDVEKAAERLTDTDDLGRFLTLEEDEELLVGTPRYMSPEQTIERRSDLRPASDVFSLGVIFYQMLTGQLPFQATNLEEIMREVRMTRPPEPREVDLGIHGRLNSIVMRMLAKDVSDRYGSMEEVLLDLEEFRSTAAEFPIAEFAAGETLFAEGDDGDYAGVVVSGEVEIWTTADGERQVLGRVVEGEALGELALLRDANRSASATALSDTRIRMISGEALMSEVEKLSPWILAILSGVVERFVDRSDRLVELLRGSDGDDSADPK